MASDHITLVRKALGFFIPYGGRRVVQRVAASYHGWTWQDQAEDVRNVVVLGGSFAGCELVKRLAETLPTGFKVVWIEKNSHLNYSFNFPRFSVMTGHEQEAFIPYDGVEQSGPTGIVTRIQDTAVGITDTKILLASGTEISYAYLAIATGSSQPLPVQVAATDRGDACHELQSVQETIENCQKIAIVGGGAVGVELAGDIKDFHPDKDVTLIHSRGRLMSHFGPRLGDYTLKALQGELKIRVLLNERPKMPAAGNMARSATLTFSDGHEEEFDLVVSSHPSRSQSRRRFWADFNAQIGCTGQRPNSSILKDLLPSAISKENARILVKPTLQVLAQEPDNKGANIFAFGDVADHAGPRMARAGWMQADVVLDNILAMISGWAPSRNYTPNVFVEGAIKLTLGKTHNVVYATDADGSDILAPSRKNPLDLGIQRAWGQFGVGHQFKQASSQSVSGS